MNNKKEKARIEHKRKVRALATKIYKELHPTTNFGFLSGHHSYFDRFCKIAENILEGRYNEL